MAVPNIKTINSCAAIQYGSTPIKAVVYRDTYEARQVWPSSIVLSNPFIVDLDEDKAYEYSYNTNTHTPSPCLKPGHHYAVKMTLTARENGVTVEEYTDCYLMHFTFNNTNGWLNNSNSHYGYPNKSPRQGSSGTGPYISESFGYSVYECYAAENASTSAQCEPYGGFFKDDLNDFVSTGYFGDKLYATPIILKRATISEDLGFYTDNEHTDSAHRLTGNGNILHINQPITIYPKLHKHASDPAWTQAGSGDWDVYEIKSFSNVTYNNSVFTVTSNQNGSYTITAIDGANNDYSITFDGNSVGFTIVGTEYRVKNGNSVIGSSGIAIQSATPLTIEECSDPLADPQVWSTYTGNNYTITSGNSNIISVSGKTLTPVSFGTSTTITVTVEGQQVIQFPITILAPSAIYYRSGKYNYENDSITWIDGNSINMSSTNPSSSWGNVSSTMYVMKFATDSSLNTGFRVYFNNTSVTTPKNAVADISEDSAGTYFVTFRNLSGQNDSFTLNVYSDYGKTNQIGTITISFYNS